MFAMDAMLGRCLSQLKMPRPDAYGTPAFAPLSRLNVCELLTTLCENAASVNAATGAGRVAAVTACGDNLDGRLVSYRFFLKLRNSRLANPRVSEVR